MKNRKISLSILVVASLVFFYQENNISDINQQWAALMAKHDYDNSWGSIGLSMFRSFFNGFTLGEFDKGGVFGETDRTSQQDEEFQMQQAALSQKSHSACWWRNFAFLAIVGDLFYLYWFRAKRTISTPEAPRSANATDSTD